MTKYYVSFEDFYGGKYTHFVKASDPEQAQQIVYDRFIKRMNLSGFAEICVSQYYVG